MKLRGRLLTATLLAIVAAVVFPAVSLGQLVQLAEIRGSVRDATGSPVVGALVTASITSPASGERIVLTDKRGSFFIPNLLAGQYSLKVSMSRFLPAQKSGIELNAGATANVTVTLQTAMDVVRRATARERAKAEDIVWTLRSSRSTQPVLRLVEDTYSQSPVSGGAPSLAYSGYFQLFSKTTETSSGATDSVGSEFAVTMPLQASAKVTFAGQYNEAPDQPRGLGALYEFTPADRHRAHIGVNLRQGALLDGPVEADGLREIQLQYGEKFQWSDHVVLDYGATVGRADAYQNSTYIRPRLAVSWVPEARTTLSLGASSQAPTAADEYFNRTVHVPPALERYLHTEAAASHVFSDHTRVSVAVFRDRADHHALFVTSEGGLRRGLLVFDARRMPSEGVRVHYDREFNMFAAGVGYTNVSGVGVAATTGAIDELGNQFLRRRFHVVTARFNADVDLTNTEITAVYRWISSFSASPLDPYQDLVEYDEPTLSFSVVQALPTWGTFPGKVQAVVDARNIFETPFAATGGQLAPSPRLLKGGINLRF